MSNKIWHSAKYDPRNLVRTTNRESLVFLVYTKDGCCLTANCFYNVHTDEYYWLDAQTGLRTLDVRILDGHARKSLQRKHRQPFR